MASLKQIEEFMGATPIALAGVSRNPKKFGQAAFRELRDKGLEVIPVNPYAEEIYGVKVYKDILSVPPEVKGVIIMTRKDQTAGVIREAKSRGIKNIWIQQMADSKEALAELKGSDLNYITGECVLMHYKPNGIHNFHKAIRKLFRVFPK
ncbi:MAG TPA: CoA-binding protein [Bacteroidales bacterium]|nr:CoA-binding protein [Bacteroidales bacterium]